MRADLRTVPFDRAAGPLIEPQRTGINTELPGDELHRVVVQLGPAAREPTEPAVELQQQREPQPGRATLASHELSLFGQH